MNALILCNGQPPPKSLFHEMFGWADLFIAADGGGNVARSLGILPDIVIGDLDSFEAREQDSFEVIHKPSQYTNDLEKALHCAKEKEATKIKVLGATGLRLDHTLKNLSVLKQFNNQFQEISFRDAYGKTCLLPPVFCQDIPIDTAVSLFPLSGNVSGLTTKGLKFPLDNDFIENGIRDGSSNTVVSRPITITHKQGDLLLFIAQ